MSGVVSGVRSLFLSDEEMGKKDDDHVPGSSTLGGHAPNRPAGWRPARVPPRRTLKRLGILALVVVAVYLFVKNIPTDVPIRDRRRPVYKHPGEGSYGGQVGDISGAVAGAGSRPLYDTRKTQPNKGGKGRQVTPPAERTYNGPIKFLNLSPSIHAIGMTGGAYSTNKNVMFAAASMKSVTALLPVACRMGMELRSYVHFVLMGRSEVEVDDLLKMNGIDEDCQVIFHDARPDLAGVSSDVRIGGAASKAFDIIFPYMHPQAVIMDGSKTEDDFFLRGIREKGAEFKANLIEIPDIASKRLLWLTKLDSSSLAAWNKISIEILIQAMPDASGNLIRLLRSLGAADYTGCFIPHLTIELPQKIDQPTESFLEHFQWPPDDIEMPANMRLLTLRHRIPRHGLNEEESQVRFLESFWPAHQHSHILILSPQVELAPNFFHYLKYALLEYKYSSSAVWQEWGRRLFGISLELPSTYLNASISFTPPSKGVSLEISKATSAAASPTPTLSEVSTSFLWQAPNSNAVLFMGDKWIELHGYVTRFLEAQRNFSSPPPTLIKFKAVSKRFPAWLEHALRLARARGYFTLYPSPDTAKTLAVVHNELFHLPEEYEKDDIEDDEDSEKKSKADEPTEVKLSAGALLDSLPEYGGLQPFNDLPLLSWEGKKMTLNQIDESAADYTLVFKRTVGGCKEGEHQVAAHKYAADLFCLPGFHDVL